jgi:hypothetical protein
MGNAGMPACEVVLNTRAIDRSTKITCKILQLTHQLWRTYEKHQI